MMTGINGTRMTGLMMIGPGMKVTGTLSGLVLLMTGPVTGIQSRGRLHQHHPSTAWPVDGTVLHIASDATTGLPISPAHHDTLAKEKVSSLRQSFLFRRPLSFRLPLSQEPKLRYHAKVSYTIYNYPSNQGQSLARILTQSSRHFFVTLSRSSQS